MSIVIQTLNNGNPNVLVVLPVFWIESLVGKYLRFWSETEYLTKCIPVHRSHPKYKSLSDGKNLILDHVTNLETEKSICNVLYYNRGTSTWPNQDDRKRPCNMTEAVNVTFFLELTENDNCKRYVGMSMTENDWKHEFTYFS